MTPIEIYRKLGRNSPSPCALEKATTACDLPSKHLISVFVQEDCQAIIDEYRDGVMSTPGTPDELTAVADRFGMK